MACWGSRAGAVVRALASHRCVSGSIPGPGVIWGVEFCCWFSTLLREVFLRVLRFSPLLKNQHFQISIRSWNARPLLNEFFELLGAPWVNRFTFTLGVLFSYMYRPWLILITDWVQFSALICVIFENGLLCSRLCSELCQAVAIMLWLRKLLRSYWLLTGNYFLRSFLWIACTRLRVRASLNGFSLSLLGRVKRRTSHKPNRMQMIKSLYSSSLSFISIRFGSCEVRRLTSA